MSPVQILEAVFSLSMQIALLVALTSCLARRNSTKGPFSERLWSSCLLSACFVVPAVLALPCLRLLPESWLNSVLTTTGTAEFDRLAWGIVAVWAAGALLSLAKLIAGWIRTFRFLNNHVSPISAEAVDVNEIWEHEIARTKTSGPGSPLLRSSSFVAGPFCWQFHRPVVVLPEAVLEFPRVELALVIRHELIHLSRQHPIQLFLQKLLDVAFWFHPLVRHLSGQLDRSRELVCDQLAIHDSVEAQAYLCSLLRLAEGNGGTANDHEGTLPFLWKRQSWIQDRVAAIAASQWKNREVKGAVWRQFTIGLMALLLCPVLRVPVDSATSRIALVSPWPKWSATALHSLGINVRDYEPNWFKTPQHEHHIPVMPDDYAQATAPGQ